VKTESFDRDRPDALRRVDDRLTGMSGMLSAAWRRKDVVELMMVTIYVVLTAYLFLQSGPPRIAFALRDAVAPVQIKARARKARAEQSATVWRSSQFDTRISPRSR
jgi:hypothetical protein